MYLDHDHDPSIPLRCPCRDRVDKSKPKVTFRAFLSSSDVEESHLALGRVSIHNFYQKVDT